MSRVGNGRPTWQPVETEATPIYPSRPFPSTTAILTGSTQQISRFGAGRSDRSRVGNVANNGLACVVAAIIGYDG